MTSEYRKGYLAGLAAANQIATEELRKAEQAEDCANIQTTDEQSILLVLIAKMTRLSILLVLIAKMTQLSAEALNGKEL